MNSDGITAMGKPSYAYHNRKEESRKEFCRAGLIHCDGIFL